MSVIAQSEMTAERSELRFVTLLLVAGMVGAAFFVLDLSRVYAGSDGYLAVPRQPFGADFVNLWTVGKMVLSGLSGDVYRHEDFMAYQQTFMQADIGLRMWAYPPHSLLLVWPFGLAGYYGIFVIWSLFGLAVLAAGARKFGFDWTETAVLALSPAALQCIAFGQTGNLACGLLLAALAGRSLSSWWSIASAAILTVKPQTGFLLPLLWILRGRWMLIASTGAATLIVVGLSVAAFGIQPWRDYLGDTLPALSDLERQGSGPFLTMIPSLFISLRLLDVDAALASVIHFASAGAAVLFLIWRLRSEENPSRQAALVLIGTCLITPYLHLYDLSILLAGALIVLRGVDRLTGGVRLIVLLAVSAGWALPKLVMPLGEAGLPISPLLIAGILAAACLPHVGDRDKPIGPGLKPLA